MAKKKTAILPMPKLYRDYTVEVQRVWTEQGEITVRTSSPVIAKEVVEKILAASQNAATEDMWDANSLTPQRGTVLTVKPTDPAIAEPPSTKPKRGAR